MKAIEINFVGSWLKNCVQGKDCDNQSVQQEKNRLQFLMSFCSGGVL